MKRKLGIFAGLLLIIFLVASYYVYNRYLGSSVPRNLSEEATYVHIPSNSSFEEVVEILKSQGIVQDEALFRQMAEYMGYIKNPMRSGRYQIKGGSKMDDLIRHLRNGEQAPVNLVLTNERLVENVAAKAARFIEPDSIDILQVLQDRNYLNQIGYTPETLMSLFIPNTYEVYWNTSPKGFVERMVKEHDRFWSQNGREDKLKKIGLDKNEVYTLASIIEKETLHNDEKKRMAGVYYNRLQKGMLLQADPTAVFARRDFSTPRVTDYHTKFDSPYNTYKYAGLPPGPISMASISSIDAVLNVENHDYLYFCAIGDGSGYHNFAESLAQHNRNAATYRANLRKRGLR